MPQPRLVYRVEHRDTGEGAFKALSWEAFDEFNNRMNWSNASHPTPHDDEGLSARFWNGDLDGHVCGCRSLAQLRKWFPQHVIDLLDDAGCELTVWKVPPFQTAHGEHQVMFRRDLAECVKQQPLTALHGHA